MHLYVMRHGIAVERGDPDYASDSDRPLTGKGRRRTRAIARGLRACKIRPDLVLTSPLVRARQTAEIVAEELELEPEQFRATNSLEPGATPNDLFSELARESGAIAQANAEPRPGREALRSVMLVGHEPGLSELISLLLTGDSHGVDIPLKKGGVAGLELQGLPRSNGPAGGGAVILKFLLQPGHLRRIAKNGRAKSRRAEPKPDGGGD